MNTIRVSNDLDPQQDRCRSCCESEPFDTLILILVQNVCKGYDQHAKKWPLARKELMPLNLFRLTSDGCSEFGISIEPAHKIVATYRVVELRMLRRACAQSHRIARVFAVRIQK